MEVPVSYKNIEKILLMDKKYLLYLKLNDLRKLFRWWTEQSSDPVYERYIC